jgi:hypothetical protein
MGGGSFDAGAYRSYSSSVASKPRAAIYTSRSIHKDLDPKGVKVRESRDSVDNPNSTPIIVGLDVTGSMGMLAENIVKEGLGTLFQGILDRKPVTDPHIMFMGIGDVHCDRAPLQVSQFEADNRIVEQLTKLWLESGGGGNSCESYDFPWYFAARHTVHDSLIKRGKRGYLFTVGDEETPKVLPKAGLSEFLGETPEVDVSAETSLAEARRMYDVFHVVIEEGDYARRALPAVKASWNALLGQHTIYLSDHKLLAQTIVSAIQVAEGSTASIAAGGWGGVASKIVGNAVANLPRGVPAPRMLGRGK